MQSEMCFLKSNFVTHFILLQVSSCYKFHLDTSFNLLQVSSCYKFHLVISFILLQISSCYKFHLDTSFILIQVSSCYKFHLKTSFISFHVSSRACTEINLGEVKYARVAVIYLVYNNTNLWGILWVAVILSSIWFKTLQTCVEYFE